MTMKSDTTNCRISLPAILVFCTMALSYMLNYFLRAGIPGTIYSQLQHDYQLSATQIGMIASSYTYIYALSQIFVGIIVDRFGGIRVTIAGSFLFVLGAFFFPLSPNITWLYLTRMLTGLGSSTMFLSLVYEINSIFGHKNYAVFMGIGYMAAYTGGILATSPFAWLCAKYNWKNVLLCIGVIIAILYILFLVCQHFYGSKKTVAAPKKKDFSPKQGFSGLLKNKKNWTMINIGTGLYVPYFLIISVFGKKFLEDYGNMDSAHAASVLFIMSIIVMCTSLSSSVATRLAGNRRKPFLFLAVYSILFSTILMNIAIYFIRDRAGNIFYLFCFCLYALSAGLAPVGTMLTQEINSPKYNTLTTGFSNMYNYLVVAVASIVVGMILDAFGQTLGGIYSPKAYMTLFGLQLLAASALCLLLTTIPETKGKYIYCQQEK